MSTKTVHIVKANGIPACEMFPTVGMQDTYDTEEEALSMIPWWRSRSHGISNLTMTWSVASSEIATDTSREWVVVNRTDLRTYWSNETGWSDLEGSDKFTDDDTLNLNLPVDGAWCRLSLAEYWEKRDGQCRGTGWRD